MAQALTELRAANHRTCREFRTDTRRTKVYIVSDVRLYREGLASSLACQRNLDLVGTGPCKDALSRWRRFGPRFCFWTSRSWRRANNFPRRALARIPTLRIIALAVAEVEAIVLGCAEAGICGYVAQDGSVEDVVAAVVRAVTGETACSPRIAAALFSRLASLSTGPAAELLGCTAHPARARDYGIGGTRIIEQGDCPDAAPRAGDDKEPRAQCPAEAQSPIVVVRLRGCAAAARPGAILSIRAGGFRDGLTLNIGFDTFRFSVGALMIGRVNRARNVCRGAELPRRGHRRIGTDRSARESIFRPVTGP